MTHPFTVSCLETGIILALRTQTKGIEVVEKLNLQARGRIPLSQVTLTARHHLDTERAIAVDTVAERRISMVGQTMITRRTRGRYLYVSVERRVESVDEIKIVNLQD
jgi:hypothetical protein